MKKTTDVKKILAYLLKGNSLTVNTCLRKFRTTELRHAISIIRKKYCLPVRTERVTHHSEPRSFNRYWISTNVIKAINFNEIMGL